MTKTTKKDFALYRKWVNFYLKRYGLNDWTVHFAHDDCGKAMAQCRTAIISRGVTFALNKELTEEDYKSLDIRHTARHEVCHLLIAEVSHLVGSFCSEDEWKRADEALVCRLTNLLSDT